jgi:hypothetical protein
MGEFLIRSMLMTIFDNDDKCDSQLVSTLQFILKTAPGQDAQTMPAMAFIDFVDFILVPHTATLLIAQDMEDDHEGARETWSFSMSYGLAINSNADDDVLEDLHRKNIAKHSLGTSVCPLQVQTPPLRVSQFRLSKTERPPVISHGDMRRCHAIFPLIYIN